MSTDWVSTLLEIARDVRDPSTAAGKEVREGLRSSSQLSEEGIELALTEHLEVEAKPAKRASLRAWSQLGRNEIGIPSRCHVVLSAHVCTAAVRALALALDTAEEVYVRPSRRDPVLARVLARELAQRGANVRLVDEVAPRGHDHVHAYGADETLDAIAGTLPAGVVLRGHGAGFGIAVVDVGEDFDAAAGALARDVVAFDQRGCLSPRVVFLVGDQRPSVDLAEALRRALGDIASRVPRGRLEADERSALARFRATMEAVGEVAEERDHLVAFADVDELLLPPAVRALLVVAVADAAAIARRVGPLTRFVTTIGALGEPGKNHAFDAMRSSVPMHLAWRASELGKMQKPPLDGPVDRRADHDVLLKKFRSRQRSAVVGV